MSPNPVDFEDWRIAGLFAKSFLADVYADARRKEKL